MMWFLFGKPGLSYVRYNPNVPATALNSIAYVVNFAGSNYKSLPVSVTSLTLPAPSEAYIGAESITSDLAIGFLSSTAGYQPWTALSAVLHDDNFDYIFLQAGIIATTTLIALGLSAGDVAQGCLTVSQWGRDEDALVYDSTCPLNSGAPGNTIAFSPTAAGYYRFATKVVYSTNGGTMSAYETYIAVSGSTSLIGSVPIGVWESSPAPRLAAILGQAGAPGATDIRTIGTSVLLTQTTQVLNIAGSFVGKQIEGGMPWVAFSAGTPTTNIVVSNDYGFNKLGDLPGTKQMAAANGAYMYRKPGSDADYAWPNCLSLDAVGNMVTFRYTLGDADYLALAWNIPNAATSGAGLLQVITHAIEFKTEDTTRELRQAVGNPLAVDELKNYVSKISVEMQLLENPFHLSDIADLIVGGIKTVGGLIGGRAKELGDQAAGNYAEHREAITGGINLVERLGRMFLPGGN
jgi:hypothetical protein